jgi:hypothetical protein
MVLPVMARLTGTSLLLCHNAKPNYRPKPERR